MAALVASSLEKTFSVLVCSGTECLITADLVESLAAFSGRTAKDLELLSTILFVADEEGLAIEEAEMSQRVKALKPKYSLAEVAAAQSELARVKATSR